MSILYGLEIAKKSMIASQQAIEVTGHNMANATTKGYTRQVVDFASVPSSAAMSAGSNSASNIGGGVIISNISQVRNAFYDTIYRSENSTLSEMNAKSTSYRYIEDIMGGGKDGA